MTKQVDNQPKRCPSCRGWFDDEGVKVKAPALVRTYCSSDCAIDAWVSVNPNRKRGDDAVSD